MTTHVLRVEDTDGVINSRDFSYSDAREGLGRFSISTTSWLEVGQEETFQYYCREYFGEVDCSGLPTGETIDLADFYFRFQNDESTQDFTFEIREHDWGGGTLTSGDFVAGSDLGSKTLWASCDSSIMTATNQVVKYSSETALKTAVALRGDLRFVMASDRQRTNNAPADSSTPEQITIYSASSSGTANDPVLGVETSDASYSGPTLDETTTGLITTGTTATVNRPGTQAECEDSLIVLFIVVDGSRTITMPSGFTALYQNISGSTSELTTTACYKIGGASEPATYSFTTNVTTRACITASRISGHDATTPIETSGWRGEGGGVAFSQPLDITTTQGNCLHLAFLGSDDGLDTGYIPGMPEVASFVSNAASFGVHAVLCSTEVIDSGTLTLISANTFTEQRVLYSIAIAPPITLVQHTATKGSMSFTGKTNSTYRRHGQDAADGSMSFSGQTSSLSRRHGQDVADGSLSFSGQANSTYKYHGQDVSDGVMNLSGQTNSTYKYHGQDVSDGVMNVSGLATTIAKLSKYSVPPGSAVFTGQSASLSRKSSQEPSPGTLTVTGGETSLQKYHAQSIATGGLTVSGTLASLSRKKAMSVFKGLLTFTGQAVTLDTASSVLVTYNVGPGHVTVNGKPTRYEPPPFITELHFPLTLPLTEYIERE